MAKYLELQARQHNLQERLRELGAIGPIKPKEHEVPTKTDVHWDFVLKEMQWLSADFTAERKRHQISRRKAANAVKTYHNNREARKARELVEARSKRRKVAARAARQVLQWWSGVERVVTYKQKISHDKVSKRQMNRQLVHLVKQTERYSESLRQIHADHSIEVALRQGTRKSKNMIVDYVRLAETTEDEGSGGESLYGTATDASDDSSYSHLDDADDETTLLQEQAYETNLRRTLDDDERSYIPDMEELSKLKEEGKMDIELVIERLKQGDGPATAAAPPAVDGKEDRRRTVHFADEHQKLDPGEDADDDADISDVEDFVDEASADGSEEFIGDDNEVDDETTLIEEENLPKEMSAAQELQMLQNENAIPVEELRRRYAAAFEGASGGNKAAAGSDGSDVDMEDISTESVAAEATEEEEFVPVAGEDADDETTIAAEEKLGRDMSYEDELVLLQSESHIPVEKLREMYAAIAQSAGGDEDDSFPLPYKGDHSPHEPYQLSQLLSMGTNDDNEEFLPDDQEGKDDETTIEAEERLGRDMSYEEEISILQRENEMPIEELHALYASMEKDESGDDVSMGDASTEAAPHADGGLAQLANPVDDQENDVEFVPVGDEIDDERTIAAEEKLGREISAEEEVAQLVAEGEMSIDDLRRLYGLERNNIEDSDSVHRDDRGDISRAEGRARKKQKVESDGDTSDAGVKALEALEASAAAARNTLASRPYLLAPWVRLREYQQIGLNWLVSLQSRRLNGILADEMGLGKTLQTISMLSYLAAYKGIWGPHLVIVPTSVILNWETELKRFCPALKVLCYYGPAKRRKELRQGWTKSNWHHVVITSYQLAVQDAFAFKRKKWYYLILDEAQNIKNFESQRWQTLIGFNTQRRLLLTGTPLQNSLMELWSLLHFLMPYIFSSRKEFSHWFANPMNSVIEGKEDQSSTVVNRLHAILRPFILRRLKKDVETQMPGKYEHIVKCQLSRRQMFIYEEFMGRSSTRQALRKRGNFMGMMNVLMQLRKVCNHPDLFEPRSIVTPLVLDTTFYDVPSLVLETDTNEVLEHVSEFYMLPLWCGSRGEASWHGALCHDYLSSDSLGRWKASFQKQRAGKVSTNGIELSSALRDLLQADRARRDRNQNNSETFLNRLNDFRCQSPAFAYNEYKLNAVNLREPSTDLGNFDFLSSPSALLELHRDQQQRAELMEATIEKFVFCVPKASAKRPVLNARSNKRRSIPVATLDQMLLEPLEECLKPYQSAEARLSSFFPDKKLVQYDSGKLQTLAELLRELKRGGHKCLIFTQMSKMLDILEAFLNLHGYAYLRLDGATGVDKRQRLMDRFNKDPQIFCFILSTRSGGLGINLTGADTCIFYDSDWNPAMDAQAQDRAHRIGQTRDVHIYRLVTEHTVEENILIKAQQKRNLDVLVMDKGKFDSSQLFKHGDSARASTETTGSHDVFTKGGLRSILGVSDANEGDDAVGGEVDGEGSPSQEQMETTMATLEDADDVQALRGAQKEAEEELKEFDETVEYKKDSDDEAEGGDKNLVKGKAGKAARRGPDEQEKASQGPGSDIDFETDMKTWETRVGADIAAIDKSLSPMERYALRFKEERDPYYSIYAVKEYELKLQEEEDEQNAVNIEEIENMKRLEERKVMDDGDILCTDPGPDELVRQRNLYRRERSRLKAARKRRKLTGENWEERVDGVTEAPFWYNIDTGEALWDKPQTLVQLELLALAADQGWSVLPKMPLTLVMDYLSHHPDRIRCSHVCRHWNKAASDPAFVRHVYPVEMGALVGEGRALEHNHFRTVVEALTVALPGETIELSDGHYWIQDDLTIDKPVRFVGDEHNPSNVVLEMNGSITWNAKGGWCEGVTFRRPKLSGNEGTKRNLLELRGRLDVINSVFDNGGGSNGNDPVRLIGSGMKGSWRNVVVKGGKEGISAHPNAILRKDNVCYFP